jgi:soluble lytic murein transglycosylase-like protein
LAFASSASAGSLPPSFTAKFDDQIKSAVHRWWGDYPDWLSWKAQLYQESLLDPNAVSGAGAAGLAQFMPGTWAEVSRELGYGVISRHLAGPAIEGGAYYMAKQRRIWSGRNRTPDTRQELAQASYNTGAGNVLKAQRLCSDALLWAGIAPCMRQVTGPDAQQTIDYVQRIARWRSLMAVR